MSQLFSPFAIGPVDLPNRIVVLQWDEGPPVTLKVDEQARNLPQLRVGDAVSKLR